MKFLWNMWCDETSESGEDEIYFRVDVHTVVTQSYVVPQQGLLHFNDHGTKQSHNNIVLADLPLADGEWAVIVVTIWEHDPGFTWGIQIDVGGQGTVLDLEFTDDDDLIGGFSVQIDMGKEAVAKTAWRPGVYVSAEVPEDQTGGGPGSYGFRFRGDGSNYFGWDIAVAHDAADAGF
jgi:hypothetical protein